MSAMPVHATSSIPQSIASTSSAPDAFDAIVQAANPSHPNHAAWVERYGGSHSRKASSKTGEDGAADDHTERASIVSQRRRRASNATTKSYGGASSTAHLASPQKERKADSHSRLPSNGSNSQVLNSSASQRLVEGATSPQMDTLHPRSPEMPLKRKGKKKRDKGKERGSLPPIPPPRTTSQFVQQPSPPLEVPFRQASTSSSPRQHGSTSTQTHHSVGFPLSPSTSMSPLYADSTHSRNTSLSQHGTVHSHGYANGQKIAPKEIMPPPKKSTLRPKHPAGTSEPPVRLSSMLARVDATNEEQKLARTAATSAMHKQQIPVSPPLPSPSQALSRRDSHRSVEFALPEEPKRRGSIDTYGLRKSFDTLVSPFRDGRKQSQRGVAPAPKMGEHVAPILKGSTSSDRFTGPPSPLPPIQTDSASRQVRLLSCVVDESEGGREVKEDGADVVSVPPATSLYHDGEDTVVPLHPHVAASPRGGDLTEEDGDFYDAQSDEGGNGSSADDADALRKAASSSKQTGDEASRRKPMRKHLEHAHIMKPRTSSSAAAAGLGVGGLASTMPLSVPAGSPTERMESSASEIENRLVGEAPRKSLHQDRIEEGAKEVDSRRSMSRVGADKPVSRPAATAPYPASHTAPRDTTVLPSAVSSSSSHAVRGTSSGNHGVAQASIYDQAHTREGLGEEGQLKYPFETSPGSYFFPGSSSSRSMANWNSEPGVASPLSPNRSFAFPTSQSMQASKSKDGSSKSFSRPGKGGFAGVMARIRRDRPAVSGNKDSKIKAESPDFYAGSPSLTLVERPEEREANGKSFGLGIAASTSPDPSGVEEGAEVPAKKWRTRLTSLSGKANKSPRVNGGSEEGKFEDVVAMMPAKAKKMLLEGGNAADPAEHQTQGRSPLLDDSNNRLAASRPSMAKERGAQTGHMDRSEFSLKKSKSSIDFRETTSLTIHKTLSPALLTDQKHEVDEAASFIGSEKDNDSKRETWNSLSNFELSPDQSLLSSATQPAPSPYNVERSTVGLEGNQGLSDRSGFVHSSVDGTKADASAGGSLASDLPSLTARRFSNGTNRLTSKTSDGALRKLAPSALNLSSRPPPPPPLPPMPRSGSVSSPSFWDQPSVPTSRRSLDARTAFRSISSGFPPQAGGARKESVDYARRAGSFAFDREATPSSFYSPFAADMKSPSLSAGGFTPKFGKRIFSGGVKSKNKLRGISSNDFYIAGGPGAGFPAASKSEVSLHSAGRHAAEDHHFYSHQHQHQQQHGGGGSMIWPDVKNRREIDEMDNGLERAHEATKLLASTADTMVNTPTTSQRSTSGVSGGLQSAQLSPTTTLNNHQQYHVPEEEVSAFDRMLRETAKEDAARLRQISTRAQRSPV